MDDNQTTTMCEQCGTNRPDSQMGFCTTCGINLCDSCADTCPNCDRPYCIDCHDLHVHDDHCDQCA